MDQRASVLKDYAVIDSLVAATTTNQGLAYSHYLSTIKSETKHIRHPNDS
jgi:hypothetical protein